MSGQATPHIHPGLAIRERRESLGLGREYLAYKAQVSLKTIERIERGEVVPRRSTLSVIHDALDMAEAA